MIASARGKQLELEDAEDPDLERFIGAYRHGPKTPGAWGGLHRRGRGASLMGSPKAGNPRLVAVLAVAAVAFFGLAVWLYLSGRPPGDDSPEAGFARDMIVHHAQAVEMAEIVRDRTESEEIRILATDIVLTQQAQIGMMLGWLDVWGLPATSTEPADGMDGASHGGKDAWYGFS